MSARPSELSCLSVLAGTAAVLVLLGGIAAVVLADSVPFEMSAPALVVGQLAISVWFSIVGFRRGAKWMIVWLFAFFILFPPATVVFWIMYRHKDFSVLT